MSGGDRIAIECLKRWTHSFRRILVVTTLAGKALYVRNAVLQADYLVTTRMVLRKHSLLNNIALQFLSITKCLLTLSRLLKYLQGQHSFLYSASDFPADFLPALIAKILRPRCIWVTGFFLFAPSPVSQESPYRGTRTLGPALWHITQIPIISLVRTFADVVFVTNELDRHRLAYGKRLPLDRIVAVRGGVDLRLSRDVPDSLVKTYDGVFVGRLHPQKGILELAEIWRFVCRRFPGAKLAIIGNGELEDELRMRIARTGLTQNIDMLGFMDGREKIRILKRSKIVLHPVIYDSGGMAPAEAMACGLPGICFDLPALRTYYPRGMLRVPRYDLEKFAEAILCLLENRELYSRFSSEALEEAKSWDWDRRARDMLEAIMNHPLFSASREHVQNPSSLRLS